MKLAFLLVYLFLTVHSAQIRADDFLPGFLREFDTDKNGVIDAEERQAIKEFRLLLEKRRTQSIDTDNDGKVSPKERRAAHRSVDRLILLKRQRQFESIAGEDGLISRDEFLTIPSLHHLSSSYQSGIFVRLDTDESGDISAQEFIKRLRVRRP